MPGKLKTTSVFCMAILYVVIIVVTISFSSCNLKGEVENTLNSEVSNLASGLGSELDSASSDTTTSIHSQPRTSNASSIKNSSSKSTNATVSKGPSAVSSTPTSSLQSIVSSNPTSSKNEPPVVNTSGNTSANYSNGAIVASQGDWIYYSNSSDGGKLYKKKKDNTGKTALNTFRSSFVSVVSDWIYYYNDNHDIYKTHVNGNSTIGLNQKTDYQLFVISDMVYFSGKSPQSGFYSMKTDGTNVKRISNNPVWCATIHNDYIYYSNENDDRQLYKLKTDGSVNAKISALDNVWKQMVIGDWIYHAQGPGTIYRTRSDGSQNTALFDSDEFSHDTWNISGDWIYYSDLDSGHIHRIKTNGTSNSLLVTDGTSNLCMVDDRIYYTDASTGKLYRMNLDGSGRQLFE